MRRIFLGVAAASLLAAMPAAAQTFNLSLSGASPGGLWSRIGGGMDAAVAAAYPGSTITYQTSSGGLANIALVSAGKVPMGLATDGDVALAVAGKAPFKAPVTNIRVLIRPYAPSARFQATHLLLRKDFAEKYGIKTFADIVNKKAPLRVAVNRRGNLDGDVSLRVMELMGASEKAIESWGGRVVRAASREQTSLILDRRIDMVNFGIAYNHPRVREIAKGADPVLLQIPRNVAKKVADEFGGEVCTFKPGEYKFASGEINSVCIGSVIVVNANMPEKQAYDLTKAVFTKMDKFKTAHRLIAKHTTAQSLAQKGGVPHHPGAARYLREAGLLK